MSANLGGYISATFNPLTSGVTSTVEYLVVAGGGAGITVGGAGGGAGGLLQATNYAITVGSSITITIGAGAKIGSNAVVVKDVPANATAVGIPARILEEEKTNKTDSPPGEQNTAFTAYAVIDDNDKFNHEAMSKALQALLDHSAKQDAQLALLTLQLKSISAETINDTDVAKAFDVKQSTPSV